MIIHNVSKVLLFLTLGFLLASIFEQSEERSHGRTIAELKKNGINIQRLMVLKGYARICEQYADPCPWGR